MGKVIFYSSIMGTTQTLPDWAVILTGVLTIAIALAIYLFRSIGVYTLAKRNGVSKAWMAWFPGLWIYPVCMLVAEYRFFGRPFRNLAVLFTVLITVIEVFNLAYSFITDFPIVGYFLSGGMVYVGEGAEVLADNIIPYWTGGGIYVTNAIIYPYPNISLLIAILNVASTFTSLLSFAEVLITLNVFIALFRKFWIQHYVVAAVMSFFGLFPFFVFAIRKNRPMDYASYIKNKYQSYYNGYNPHSGYSQNQTSPFDEYPNKENRKNEDPFEEFSDKNR